MSSTTRMVKVKDTAHNCLMLEILPELYQAERHVDVTFHCKDGKQLKAHRLLLGSVSPFLQALFNDQRSRDMVDVLLPDIDSNDLDNLLRFIYEGLIRLDDEEIQPFWHLKEMFALHIPAVISQNTDESSEDQVDDQPPMQDDSISLSPQKDKSAQKKRRMSHDAEIPSKVLRVTDDKDNRRAIIDGLNVILNDMSTKSTEPVERQSNSLKGEGPLIVPLEHFKNVVKAVENYRAEKKLQMLVNEAVLNCLSTEKETLEKNILKKLKIELDKMKENIEGLAKNTKGSLSLESVVDNITSVATTQLRKECNEMIKKYVNLSKTESGSMPVTGFSEIQEHQSSEVDIERLTDGKPKTGNKQSELSKSVDSVVQTSKLPSPKLGSSQQNSIQSQQNAGPCHQSSATKENPGPSHSGPPTQQKSNIGPSPQKNSLAIRQSTQTAEPSSKNVGPTLQKVGLPPQLTTSEGTTPNTTSATPHIRSRPSVFPVLSTHNVVRSLQGLHPQEKGFKKLVNPVTASNVVAIHSTPPTKEQNRLFGTLGTAKATVVDNEPLRTSQTLKQVANNANAVKSANGGLPSPLRMLAVKTYSRPVVQRQATVHPVHPSVIRAGTQPPNFNRTPGPRMQQTARPNILSGSNNYRPIAPQGQTVYLPVVNPRLNLGVSNAAAGTQLNKTSPSSGNL